MVLTALLALSCGDGSGALPVPDILDPSCTWYEREVITADSTCIHLVAGEGASTRFLAERDQSCEGAPCVLLRAGESAVVVGPVSEPYSDYDLTSGDCSALPECIP